MAKPKLTLYFDIISPFGYLAYYITRVSECLDAWVRAWVHQCEVGM